MVVDMATLVAAQKGGTRGGNYACNSGCGGGSRVVEVTMVVLEAIVREWWSWLSSWRSERRSWRWYYCRAVAKGGGCGGSGSGG